MTARPAPRDRAPAPATGGPPADDVDPALLPLIRLLARQLVAEQDRASREGGPPAPG